MSYVTYSTYGFSNIRRQTLAIVLRVSVVFSIGMSEFWNKIRAKLFYYNYIPFNLHQFKLNSLLILHMYHYFIYNASPSCDIHTYDATVKLKNAKFQPIYLILQGNVPLQYYDIHESAYIILRTFQWAGFYETSYKINATGSHPAFIFFYSILLIILTGRSCQLLMWKQHQHQLMKDTEMSGDKP